MWGSELTGQEGVTVGSGWRGEDSSMSPPCGKGQGGCFITAQPSGSGAEERLSRQETPRRAEGRGSEERHRPSGKGP